MTHDVVIIGGGIVGLASAYKISEQHPDMSLVVLEKESQLATHQTGRNSGVIHSGIYYKPGSLKAQNCRNGKALLESFCRRENIPTRQCGKVIVATDAREEDRLFALYRRGLDHGVSCELIDAVRLKELEPHARGRRAILVHDTGIVDYVAVCRRLAALLTARGHLVRTGQNVRRLIQNAHEVRVLTDASEHTTRCVINCGGLQSDRIAVQSGDRPDCRIIPFRGEYFQLKPAAERLCRTLIYPVPDPDFPFLGVHFTTMIGGGVECGPNAVLAWAREGYRKWNFNPKDMAELVTYRGFWRMGRHYWRMGIGEYWRSWNKAAFVKALQKLVPDIRAEDLEPAPSGVRAQAVSVDGRMVDDFVIRQDRRVIHVINAPSPAATASLAIGQHVAGLVSASGVRQP